MVSRPRHFLGTNAVFGCWRLCCVSKLRHEVEGPSLGAHGIVSWVMGLNMVENGHALGICSAGGPTIWPTSRPAPVGDLHHVVPSPIFLACCG